MNRSGTSRPAARWFAKLLGLAVVVAVAAWCLGYLYLVKVVGWPATGFFTLKMMAGLLIISILLCSVFWLPFRVWR